METQNTQVTINLLETTADTLLPDSAPFETPNREFPDIDRELLARIRDLTVDRITLQPGIRDRNLADYPALGGNFESRTQVASTGRVPSRRRESASLASLAWVMATLAILGLLTAMLIVGIAVSV